MPIECDDKVIQTRICEEVENRINEHKLKYNPRIGAFEYTHNKTDVINPMNRKPLISGEIVLLNTINALRTEGNKRYAITVYYDNRSGKIFDKRGGNILFDNWREARTADGRPASGWVNKSDYPYQTR